jgi:RimJ/RimL family protein N-acetyltransferase
MTTLETVDTRTLETERLRLRPFRLSDHEDYAEMCADPEVMRHFGKGEPFARDAAWRHMAMLVGHWDLLGFGMWAVEEKETGRFVGRVGFAEPGGWPGFELAWALARPFWGRGYATESGRAALAWAFAELGKERVISLIVPENRRSLRVAERLGEILQGRTEAMGKRHLIYGIDRERWREAVGGELPGGAVRRR